MKREQTSFFSNFFGGKGQSYEGGQPTPVITTSYSQPHVLQQRMKEEKLTHGETVTANISPVRLETSFGKMIMYFCPMKSLEVLQVISNGDGGSIPSQVKVEGLSVPAELKSGMYKLKNVTLTSNGTMQVNATESTVWERTEADTF
ncbi:MAG: hypothetical protein ACTHK0_19280 [Ginsengibacter sp.]